MQVRSVHACFERLRLTGNKLSVSQYVHNSGHLPVGLQLLVLTQLVPEMGTYVREVHCLKWLAVLFSITSCSLKLL